MTGRSRKGMTAMWCSLIISLISGGNTMGVFIHINALCQQRCHNLFLKIDISWNQFTQYFRLGIGVMGGRGMPERGGGRIRAGLEGSCNLLTGSWERASHHRQLFLRSVPSGYGNTVLFLFFLLFPIRRNCVLNSLYMVLWRHVSVL